jgi:hypothetical protein
MLAAYIVMVSLMGGTSQSIDKNKRHPKATEKGVKKFAQPSPGVHLYIVEIQ